MTTGGHGGDAGLIAAWVGGVVTLLGLIGGGIKWAVRWRERHQDRRAVKLQQWHDELVKREARLDQEREQHIQRLEREIETIRIDYQTMRRQHSALLGGYQMLAAALRAIEPNNAALRMADELLRAAFPPDPVIPADMAAALMQIDEADRGETR